MACAQGKKNTQHPNAGKSASTGEQQTDRQRKSQVVTLIKAFEDEFKVPNMEASEAIKQVDSKNYVFVDVREDNEWQVSHIKNAITAKEFERNKDQYKGKKVVAYCTIGYRSSEYVQKLKKSGFDAYNLRGSILLWAHEGGTLVDAKGKEVKSAHVYGSTWDLLPDGYQSVLND
jgi:sodium/bile acid cotransporter 7